jgi:hypothetical protein
MFSWIASYRQLLREAQAKAAEATAPVAKAEVVQPVHQRGLEEGAIDLAVTWTQAASLSEKKTVGRPEQRVRTTMADRLTVIRRSSETSDGRGKASAWEPGPPHPAGTRRNLPWDTP